MLQRYIGGIPVDFPFRAVLKDLGQWHGCFHSSDPSYSPCSGSPTFWVGVGFWFQSQGMQGSVGFARRALSQPLCMSFSTLFADIHRFGLFGAAVLEFLLSVGLVGGLDRHGVSMSLEGVRPLGRRSFIHHPFSRGDPLHLFPGFLPTEPAAHRGATSIRRHPVFVLSNRVLRSIPSVRKGSPRVRIPIVPFSTEGKKDRTQGEGGGSACVCLPSSGTQTHPSPLPHKEGRNPVPSPPKGGCVWDPGGCESGGQGLGRDPTRISHLRREAPRWPKC